MKPSVIILTLILCSTSIVLNAQQQIDTLRIFFDIDQSIIDDGNAKLLDKLILHKEINAISICCYADFLGSKEYNQQLSKKRSRNIYNYLLNQGINRAQILFCKGVGVHPNSSASNRQDISDKGIQAHRVAEIIYTVVSQKIHALEEPLEERLIMNESTLEKEISATHNLRIEELIVNNTIELENIYFYSNEYEFRSESYPALVELFEIMQANPTLKIEIQGHIFSAGFNNEVYIEDKPLSLCRAQKVFNYLVENGIDPSRMTCKGYGATSQRYDQPEDRWRNMRVEILILEK